MLLAGWRASYICGDSWLVSYGATEGAGELSGVGLGDYKITRARLGTTRGCVPGLPQCRLEPCGTPRCGFPTRMASN